MISAYAEGSIDVNLTPDKRQIFIEKESVIWDTVKDKLKEIFDKIAPPEMGLINNSDSNKLTSYFEEIKIPVSENGDVKMEENSSTVMSEFKAKLSASKLKRSSCEPLKTANSRFVLHIHVEKWF